MPSFVLLTEAKVADVTVTQGLTLNPKPWLYPGLEPGLPGLFPVWQVDRPKRLLRHPPQI
ncbi:hypothetical protein DFAR_520003 [Desulfarculales bacterium]